MGDPIELTTWPSHKNVFYRMSAGAILFDVKAAGSAAIGLAKKPGDLVDVWVVIGHFRTWIKKEEGGSKSVITPNILSNGEYRRFWLSWRNGCIQLGQNDDSIPIITHVHHLDLSYVTFASGERGMADRTPVYWRFELPPVLEKPRMKSVTGGGLVWVHADNQLPDGALIGGYEKEMLYIIRAAHRGSLTPGKFVPSQGTGYISWGGESHGKNIFEVLCGFDCTWVPSFEDRIPVGAVEGGCSEGPDRETLYVGRALYSGQIIPGKVQPSHKCCYIAYGDREVAQKKFEILVSADINARCANRLFIDHIDVESPSGSEHSSDDEYLANYR
ncbi:uncharacterized protein LOC114355576 [Ostrinia furnacalis]|uniref:uncharacterized protein LOC114355576 n=1 Tax=Ostrinia furnacalis TaxID=93504 RepID=UPI00103913B9|nr:uncharacterized protein LOC114355576 [Ostrinia furnacalis]